jgi:hypothetical protein
VPGRHNLFATENLAFFIQNQDAKFGRKIWPNDVFVTMTRWEGYHVGSTACTLAVFVSTQKTTKILHVQVAPKEKVLESLAREVDKILLSAVLVV